MSNNTTASGPDEIGEERGNTNVRQRLLVGGSIGLSVVALIAGSVHKKHNLGGQNTVISTLTGEQQGLAESLTYDIPTFQGLPVTRSGNKEDISILKESGKDGYYVFCNEEHEVTYWKVQSGVSTGGTFTLTW